jgi:hypothetical protein
MQVIGQTICSQKYPTTNRDPTESIETGYPVCDNINIVVIVAMEKRVSKIGTDQISVLTTEKEMPSLTP